MAQKGTVLTAIGGHGIVWQMAAELSPQGAVGILCCMTAQLVISTTSCSLLICGALARSVTRIELVLEDGAAAGAAADAMTTDAVTTALEADEVCIQVHNDVMWKEVRLRKPEDESKPPFSRLCELGVVQLTGEAAQPAVVEWLRNTRYVIVSEKMGWLREPPSEKLELPGWMTINEEMLGKFEAQKAKFGNMVDMSSAAPEVILRIGRILAGAGGVWICGCAMATLAYGGS